MHALTSVETWHEDENRVSEIKTFSFGSSVDGVAVWRNESVVASSTLPHLLSGDVDF